MTKTSSDYELVFSRSFAAPVAAVYQAWTDPVLLVHWWGPRGFTLTILKMELEIGGVWEYILHGPDGTDYPNRAIFQVIEPLKRLEFFNSGGHVDDNHLTCRMLVTFDEQADHTRVTLRMKFETLEALNCAKERGAEQGGTESFERLAESVLP